MKRQKKSQVKQNSKSLPLPAAKPRGQAWLFGLLLVAVTIIAYLPVWRAGFIWDDDVFLTDNPVIKSADGLYKLWFTASTPDYFPMTSSMLWLEWHIWGGHPLGYHLVNVLLHAFSAVLLWRVLQRLKIPGAWLAAALFAVHPVNVESVAWITEGKNTLAMFFYAGALLAWLKFEDSGWGRWYGLALAAFALALLSKTAVVPLPLVLLGLAWWQRGRVEWKDVRRIAPFFVIAMVLGLVTMWFQYHQAINGEVVRSDDFASRLAGAGWAVWFYLYKTVLPVNLIFVYPRWHVDPRNVLSYLPLVLLVAAFVLCWRYKKAIFFSVAYFVVMLLPILGFLNIYFMRYSLVADHWEYFAIIGPIALAAAVIRKPILATTLLVALGVLTWRQCEMYANPETLWRTTLRRNPNCSIAYNNLGEIFLNKNQLDEALPQIEKALELDPDNVEACNNLGNILVQKGKVDEGIAQYQKGLAIHPDWANSYYNLGLAFLLKGNLNEAAAQFQKALQLNPSDARFHLNLGTIFLQKGNLDEAIAQFQQAVQINSDYAEPHYNLGLALLKQGIADEAIRQFEQALKIKPRYTEAHNNLGNSLMQKGQVDDAIAQFQEALQINPAFDEAHYNLGNALRQKGREAEAILQYQNAVQINPDYADAHLNLATVLGNKGRPVEAIVHFQKALQLAPNDPKVLNNLAWLLATDPDASVRNGRKAVELARQANTLTGETNPIVLYTLAAALAEAGQFAEAVQTARRALSVAEAQSNAMLVGQLQAQLKLYQAGEPFHSSAK